MSFHMGGGETAISLQERDLWILCKNSDFIRTHLFWHTNMENVFNYVKIIISLEGEVFINPYDMDI